MVMIPVSSIRSRVFKALSRVVQLMITEVYCGIANSIKQGSKRTVSRKEITGEGEEEGNH